MKLKKLFSAAAAAMITVAALPCVSFAGTPDHSTVIAGNITYYKYSDHVEVGSAFSASGTVDIQARISGLPVTAVGEKAFSGSDVEVVNIPDSVKSIKSGAFEACPLLSYVVILGADCQIADSSTTISNKLKSDGKTGGFGGTIEGYDSSTAMAYAKKYGYTFNSLGKAPEAVTTASTAVSTTSSTTATSTTTAKVTTSTTKATTSTTKKTTSTTTSTTTTTTSTTTTTTTTAQQGKPVFKLNSTEVYESRSKGSEQQMTLSVEGADGLYCDTVVYVYFDKRLKNFTAEAGSAVETLTKAQAMGDTKDFVVLTTAGSGNTGKDGEMWRFTFALPDDCMAGDEFDIEVGLSKYGEIKPLFTNFEYDAKGTAMTEHIFTKGLAKGSIIVVEDPPYKLGDVTNDGLIDSVDASRVLAEYAAISAKKASTFTDKRQYIAADVNGDGSIDAVDASAILAFYAYLSGKEPVYGFEEFLKKM